LSSTGLSPRATYNTIKHLPGVQKTVKFETKALPVMTAFT